MSRKVLLQLLSVFFCLPLFAQSYVELSAAMGVSAEYGVGLFGGGVSFSDFNNDGLDDLTFTSANNLPLLFYRNNGSSFTSMPLVNNTQETKEAIWVDYDNDGDQDLFVTGYDSPNRLYLKSGGSLTDITEVAFGTLPNDPSFGAAWGDYDRDGFLDLYVCNYGSRNILWRGNGNGTFTDVTSSLGVGGGSSDPSFDVCILDFDGNGWQDIYVINDKYGIQNTIYFNENGVFTQSTNSGAELSIDAMNAGGGDYDNDGDFDLYVTNTEGGNHLLANDGAGVFSDNTSFSGTALNIICWGASSLDYDNDKDLDLYVAAEDFSGLLSNPFLVNLGDGSFDWPLFSSGGLGGSDVGNSYGTAIGDLNEDGLLDIVVNQSGTPAYLWQNQEQQTGNFIKVVLFGTISNQEGIGAKVEITTSDGTKLYRWRLGSQGYLSQSSNKMHFGIGTAVSIEELKIVWPSGIVDVYTNLPPINQILGFVEGEAALPVTIEEFTAEVEGSNVSLKWVVSQEINLDYYVVEKSRDGISFADILSVDAEGQSNSEVTYSATDNLEQAGDWYYRLRMVDFDGSVVYSAVRSVRPLEGRMPGIYISRLPTNPSVEEISFELYSVGVRSGTIELLDEHGRKVGAKLFMAQEGSNTIGFSCSGLPAGHYYLRLSSQDWNKTLPIILSR